MISEHKKDLSEILKKYLSHIVYIDDEFKISWKLSENEIIDRPSRSRRRIGEISSTQSDDETVIKKSNLETFCAFVQDHYPEILLTPILYTSTTDDQNLVLHMSQSRMLILDWSLSEKTTAVKLLKEVGFQGQLRFCVIYTSKLDEAKKEFIEEIPHVKKQGLTRSQYAGMEYEYVRADSVIYMLCEKDKFSPDMIIEALTDIFICEIGYFPIAFIDMISGLEEKVPYYINEFSHPFDKLLLLQTNADGLPLDDVYGTISDMVINNIKSDIILDASVLESIYKKQVQMINELVDDDDLFDERLKQSLELIIERLQCDEKNKTVLNSITKEEYKKIIKQAVSKPEEFTKGISKASKTLAKLCSEYKVKKMMLENGVLEENASILKKEMMGIYKTQFEEKIKKVLPACLMILTNPEQNYNFNSLIMSLKIVTYGGEKQWFSQLFEGCYEIREGDMLLKEQNGKPALALLQNKFYAGDILFKRDKNRGKIDECYLCIVPSCHLLRPKKVDGNILFVRGKIVEVRPEQPLRDSEHFTVLPGIEDENRPIHIIWQYHQIVAIDMNKIACKDYEAFYRPYRLSYEYIRQIVGEFVAFYSKSGVEELFFKSDALLERLLTQE